MHPITRREALLSSLKTATGLSVAGATTLGQLLTTPAEAQLGSLLGRTKVPYGIALNRWALGDESQRQPYLAAIKRYAALAVPEDGMYWENVRPTRETFDFTIADKLLAVAQANALPFRGHVLVWHGAMPKWTETILSAKEAERELVTHIERVVGRYKGKIQKWTAINEMIDEKPTGTTGDAALRPSIWYRHLGERYIDIALKTIKQVDPGASLIVNDFGIESVNPNDLKRREAYIALVRRLRDRYAPISGVGIQGHVTGEIAIDRAGLAGFCKDVKALDLETLITEIDVGDFHLPADNDIRDAVGAVRTWEILDAVFSEVTPKEVYTWGITDRYTWMPMWFKRKDGLENRVLPLDKDYKPKPMLRVIEHFCRMGV